MSPPTPPQTPLVLLPPRTADSHKGNFGHVLIIGGSQGMAGAVAMSGIAAMRSGAGLVTLATAETCQPIVASFEPAAMTVPLPCDASGRIRKQALTTLEPFLDKATTVAVGPGLGQSAELRDLVAALYQGVKQPMVVDADGLNALARSQALANPGGPRVLTPHPGEFARLLGRESISADQREPLALQFARQNGVVLVLKGHRTILTDGHQLARNTTGNPGMATGGTGDILTGIVTAILGQHLTPYDAARLGAHVHGLAGDLAASEIGQVSLIATDLLDYLPTAWQLVARGEQ